MKLLISLSAILVLGLMNFQIVKAQNTRDYKVIVRSYFNNADKDMNKATTINNKVKQKMSQYAGGGNPPTRNLRVADRELQTWCTRLQQSL
jgi:hypothetical protein